MFSTMHTSKKKNLHGHKFFSSLPWLSVAPHIVVWPLEWIMRSSGELVLAGEKLTTNLNITVFFNLIWLHRGKKEKRIKKGEYVCTCFVWNYAA